MGVRSGARRALEAAAAVVLLAAAFVPGGAGETRAQETDDAFLDRVLASLSIDERVGQLVMVNFIGDDVSAASDIAQLVRDFKVGAVLVTASNGNVINRGDTAAQLASLSNGLQQRAFEGTRRLDGEREYYVPLFVATDNEGDLFPFTNVTHNHTSIPNNMTVGATWSKQHAEAVGEIVGRELAAAGVNMLLGPVVDVLDNPRSGGRGDIGIRSFGGDPDWVGMLGRAYVRGVHRGSGGDMITVAKHFPGHGGSDRSTDNEVPTVNKSLPQLRASELAPFAEVARADEGDPDGTTDAMMVSHIRYRNFLEGGGSAPYTRPISLDRAAFTGLMNLPEFSAWRQTHFVVADSLGVPAIKQWYAREEAQPDFPNRTVVREALLAGNDLLPLVEFYREAANRGWRDYQLPVIQDSIIYLREQYVSDVDFRRRVDDAVRRIIAAKLKLYPQLALDDALVDPEGASAVAGQGIEQMQALARDALTLIHPSSVEDLRSRLPRGPVTPDKVLIVECWSDCYPYRVMTQAALQEELLRLYGPSGKQRIRREDVRTISFGDLNAWVSAPDDPAYAGTASAFTEATWVIFALAEYNPDAYPASNAVRRFLDDAPVDVRNKYMIAVAFNAPYHLDSTEISKLSAYFAVYSKTDAAIESAWQALFGDIDPHGHPPVNVSGIFYDVADATQPDPAQTLAVSVYGQDASDVPNDGFINLVAGPIIDRNGNPVADGAGVTFTLVRAGEPPVTAVGRTIDGIAGARMASRGSGEYTATASVAGIVSEPLAIRVRASAAPPPDDAASPPSSDGGGGLSPLVLGLVVGVPAVAVTLGGAVGGVLLYRRRRAAPVPAAQLELPPEPAPERLIRIDPDTRRVYVKGAEARPPLSNEQYRLLYYLYERAGKVVSREELVAHVWPDAHADGVSEEALDALVRRVRERIVQSGGERGYIVTLRGQGFRLEI